MAEQIYFDDVAEGQEIPPLKKQVTTVNILMYLAVVWLMDRIHFDKPFATQRRGLPDVVAPGNMAVDYLAQLLNDWVLPRGKLRKLSAQYRNFMVPGNTLECGGKITKKYEEEGKGYAALDLWIKNEGGVPTALGKAVVELPVR